MALSDILDEMLRAPLGFLRHYKLTISGGGATSQSGLATFQYVDQNRTVRGFTTGLSGLFGVKKDRPEIRFAKVAGPAGNPDLANGTFNAWYVAMKQTSDAQAATHFALSTQNGPGIMLTSQLSGCTFGIGNQANGVQLVSHIQPSGNRVALHNAVTGGMANGVAALYERENQPGGYDDPLNRATIIGIRRNGSWRYYAQLYKTGTGGAVLEAKQIN